MIICAGDAVLSEDQRYRYLLRRQWIGASNETCLFVMLNPSTADASNDDATLRKCVGYANRWGYSGLSLVNLFALRSRDPKALAKDWTQSVGPDNDKHIEQALQRAHQVIVAWGANETMGRDQAVLTMLRRSHNIYCLRTTKAGKPEHPLYLPADLTPSLFARKTP